MAALPQVIVAIILPARPSHLSQREEKVVQQAIARTIFVSAVLLPCTACQSDCRFREIFACVSAVPSSLSEHSISDVIRQFFHY